MANPGFLGQRARLFVSLDFMDARSAGFESARAFEVYQGVQEAEGANRELLKNLATGTTQQLKAITQQVESEHFAAMTPAQQQQHVAAENFVASLMAR